LGPIPVNAESKPKNGAKAGSGTPKAMAKNRATKTRWGLKKQKKEVKESKKGGPDHGGGAGKCMGHQEVREKPRGGENCGPGGR